MLGRATAGSVAGEAAAASCAHPGLFDPWEVQLAPLTQYRCSHWDSGLSGVTCGGNADDQGGAEMIRGMLR